MPSTSSLPDKELESDEVCGNNSSTSNNGTAGECGPDNENPCCGTQKYCGHSAEYCSCLDGCVDYRVVRDMKRSEDNCTVTEVGGFLKNVCFNETKKQYYYKCTQSDESYETSVEWSDTDEDYTALSNVTAVCEDDPYFYQACGFHTTITNNEVFCGGYFCDNQFVRCSTKCSEDKRDCASEAADLRCDDKCDKEFCEDESDCNGHRYGVHCDTVQGGNYVPASWVCDKVDDCENAADEQNCTFSESETLPSGCNHYFTKKPVPILNYTRCGIFDSVNRAHPYCENYLDQTNCSDSDRIGGSCTVNNYLSRVPRHLMCDSDSKMRAKDTIEVDLCDDDIENKCHSPILSTSNCKVHKHKMCNKVYDCPDKSDEYDAMCSHMTDHFKCERRFYPNEVLKFPYRWVKDNVKDCINEEDENENKWSVCPFENEQIGTTKSEKISNKSCQNVMKRPPKRSVQPYVEFENLCDGIESFGLGIENNVCKIARDFPTIITTLNSNKQNGSELCTSLKSSGTGPVSCRYQEFKGESTNKHIFGAMKEQFWAPKPNRKVHCNDTYGEYYVYLSCMGLCLEIDASCPLNYQPLRYNSCPGQYRDRVYTLENNTNLTFVLKSGDRYDQPRVFQCKNGKCVNYSQVCNLIDDCGDWSDENDCINHLVCLENASNPQLMAFEQWCDGIYDCFDLSDECNDQCTKNILDHLVTKCLCWFKGILAVSLNIYTVCKGVITIKDCETDNMLITKALITVISCGDLLMGVYLVVLSIYDSIVFSGGFCKEQVEWLTGTACSSLGVISTLGSQMSVFAMTLLSINRAYGFVFNEMKVPSPPNKKAVLKTVLSVIGVVTAALAVALIPLVPALEDYFVQGMHYDPEYKLFVGFPNKARHFKILSKYYNNTSAQGDIALNMTWREIGEKVDDMFTQDYGKLERKAVHFYGNDGVCLFKYFVRTDDARRSRQTAGTEEDSIELRGDPIVWVMLGINLICFILITVTYTVINLKTQWSSKTSGSCQNPVIQKQNRELQNRVTVLIATDFFCWVPLIIVSGLHNLKVIDATFWYVPFAMVLFPLNSVVNPLIYDNYLRGFIFAKVQSLVTSVTNSRAFIFIRQQWQARNRTEIVEEIELQAVERQITKHEEDTTKHGKDSNKSLVRPARESEDIIEDHDDKEEECLLMKQSAVGKSSGQSKSTHI